MTAVSEEVLSDAIEDKLACNVGKVEKRALGKFRAIIG